MPRGGKREGAGRQQELTRKPKTLSRQDFGLSCCLALDGIIEKCR